MEDLESTYHPEMDRQKASLLLCNQLEAIAATRSKAPSAIKRFTFRYCHFSNNSFANLMRVYFYILHERVSSTIENDYHPPCRLMKEHFIIIFFSHFFILSLRTATFVWTREFGFTEWEDGIHFVTSFYTIYTKRILSEQRDLKTFPMHS